MAVANTDRSDPDRSDPGRAADAVHDAHDAAIEDELRQSLRKFQKELSAGTVSLVLLAVVAEARAPMYGYQIAKQLEHFGDGVLSGKQSALYPVLRNLGAAGLLESHVEPSDAGPPRKYYRITSTGRDVLAQWIAAWSATRDSVDSVLRGMKP